MVLQDDQFATIVAAVEQGRVIFDNIRAFVIYLLSGNVGEILAVGTASVTGAPLPLLPLQILYLNLLNDVFPALALGMGRGASEVMQRPPRDPQEAVLTRNHWQLIGGYGVLIAIVLLGAFCYALYVLDLPIRQAVTVSFLTLSITRLLHAFNMRNPATGILDNDITRNPFVWGALVLCLTLLLVAVYVPFLANILQVAPPGPREWLLIISASVITLISGQLYLAFSRRTSNDPPQGRAT
jgi:Ca2+-transporting ATPase